MADKGEPEQADAEYAYEPFIQKYAEEHIPEVDWDTFWEHMSFESLQALREEVSFFTHIRANDGE